MEITIKVSGEKEEVADILSKIQMIKIIDKLPKGVAMIAKDDNNELTYLYDQSEDH